MPGDKVEPGETLEACAIREMIEETGLTIAIDRLVYVCDRIQDGRHVVHSTFAVHRVTGTLHRGVEPEPDANPITNIRMVPLTDLPNYGFDLLLPDMAGAGFPNSGTYQGLVANIGL